MNIDLTKLVTSMQEEIDVDIEVKFPNEMYDGSRIKNVKDACFKRNITKTYDGDYVIEGILAGTMVIDDDITLEDVDYKFRTEIEEEFDEFGQKFENNLKIIQNTLDITEFLWQNILVEIPLKVVSEKNKDLKLEGNGWRFITEEDLENSNNSPFSELQEKFNSREE